MQPFAIQKKIFNIFFDVKNIFKCFAFSLLLRRRIRLPRLFLSVYLTINNFYYFCFAVRFRNYKPK